MESIKALTSKVGFDDFIGDDFRWILRDFKFSFQIPKFTQIAHYFNWNWRGQVPSQFFDGFLNVCDLLWSMALNRPPPLTPVALQRALVVQPPLPHAWWREQMWWPVSLVWLGFTGIFLNCFRGDSFNWYFYDFDLRSWEENWNWASRNWLEPPLRMGGPRVELGGVVSENKDEERIWKG